MYLEAIHVSFFILTKIYAINVFIIIIIIIIIINLIFITVINIAILSLHTIKNNWHEHILRMPNNRLPQRLLN